jgi:TIR domain
MTYPNKAVFLSYASQDTEAAQDLCNAFRAAGIEVWFDQSELRGGDAWDQMIRRQVKGCYLFVPIISANTQSRKEGYFRREWKIAVDRTNDMAEGTAFLLPVVIDGTSNSDALVPEKFREMQWTRLPVGANTDSFVEQVRLLL